MLQDIPKDFVLRTAVFLSKQDAINLASTCTHLYDVFNARLKKTKFLLKWRKLTAELILQDKLIKIKQECRDSSRMVMVPDICELFIPTKSVMQGIRLYSSRLKDVVNVVILMTSLEFTIVFHPICRELLLEMNLRLGTGPVIETRCILGKGVELNRDDMVEILSKFKFCEPSRGDWRVSWVNVLCAGEDEENACQRAGFLKMENGYWRYNPISEEDIWLREVIPLMRWKIREKDQSQ